MDLITNNITFFYAFLLVTIGFGMKFISIVSIKLTNAEKVKFLFLGPTPDYSTVLKKTDLTRHDIISILKVFFLELLFLSFIYYFKETIFFSKLWIVNSYIALFPFYLLTDCYGRLIQLLSLKDCGYLPPVHNKIFHSSSLGNFWGIRWNTYFSDWFRSQIFKKFSHNHFLGSLLVFFISAVIHEIIVNVPLHTIYGVNMYGSMMLYFGIQCVGVYLEKRLNLSLLSRKIYLWSFIVLPAPLVINLGTLRLTMFLPH
ncbi:MAG: MBOAT family protein [Bacteriovoracaceae bacterium]